MEPNEKLAQLESEIKILKNEVQAVLLDLRDKYLEAENPFNQCEPPTAISQQTIVHRQVGPAQEAPNVQPTGNGGEEGGPPEAAEPARVLNDNGTSPDIAPEEVKRVRRPQTGSPQDKPRRPAVCLGGNDELDLVAIGGLVRWADESTRKLGRARAETILDVCEMMGLLVPEMKRVLTKLIKIEGDTGSEGGCARDYLRQLIEITTLLGKDNRTETTLLAILSEENGHR